MTDLEKYLTELLVEADKTSQMQAQAITALTKSQETLNKELETVKAQLNVFETSLQSFSEELQNGLKKLDS